LTSRTVFLLTSLWCVHIELLLCYLSDITDLEIQAIDSSTIKDGSTQPGGKSFHSERRRSDGNVCTDLLQVVSRSTLHHPDGVDESGKKTGITQCKIAHISDMETLSSQLLDFGVDCGTSSCFDKNPAASGKYCLFGPHLYSARYVEHVPYPSHVQLFGQCIASSM
jgi:hypothetical protein